jgi:hypothetical protein
LFASAAARPPRRLGNEAAGDERPERAIERRALQPDRLAWRQDAVVLARRRGGKQGSLGVGELGHDLGPCGRPRGMRGLPLTEGLERTALGFPDIISDLVVSVACFGCLRQR